MTNAMYEGNVGAKGVWGRGMVRVLQFLHLSKDRNPCSAHFCGILLISTTITNVKNVGGGAKKLTTSVYEHSPCAPLYWVWAGAL